MELIGAGHGAREVVHVRNADGSLLWDLSRSAGNDAEELRVDHRLVAPRLGYAYPHKFAELIRTHKHGGFISPVEVLPAKGEASGGRRGRVYMLSRDEIVYLIGKAETKESNRLMAQVARLFNRAMDELRRRRHDALSSQWQSALVRISETNTKLVARIEALETRFRDDVGLVSAEWAEEHIHAKLRRIAALEAGTNDHKVVRRCRRSAENRLRNIVCFNGPGTAWTKYPRDRQLIRILENALELMMNTVVNRVTADVRARADARARAETEAQLKQLGLFAKN